MVENNHGLNAQKDNSEGRSLRGDDILVLAFLICFCLQIILLICCLILDWSSFVIVFLLIIDVISTTILFFGILFMGTTDKKNEVEKAKQIEGQTYNANKTTLISKEFNISKTIKFNEFALFIDDLNKKFVLQKNNQLIGKIYNYNQLIGVSLGQNGKMDTVIDLKGALVGGILFGSFGAALGGTTKKERCNSLLLLITLNDLNNSQVSYEFLNQNQIKYGIDKNSDQYKLILKILRNIISVFEYIKNSNSEVISTEPNTDAFKKESSYFLNGKLLDENTIEHINELLSVGLKVEAIRFASRKTNALLKESKEFIESYINN